MPDETSVQETTNDQESIEGSDQGSQLSIEEVRKLRRENQGLRKRLHEAEAAEQQRKEADMTEVERLKKQLGDYQQKETQWASEKRNLALRQAIQGEAAKQGIVDPDAAYRLLDVDLFEVGDDGIPQGIDKAVQELLKSKPYLKGTAMSPMSPTNPANPGRQPQMFTRTQLRDTKFFAEHQAEIMQAMKDGRILDE